MNGFLNILYEVIHYKTFWPKWDKSTDSHLNAIGISAANKVSVQMAIYFMVFRRVSSIQTIHPHREAVTPSILSTSLQVAFPNSPVILCGFEGAMAELVKHQRLDLFAPISKPSSSWMFLFVFVLSWHYQLHSINCDESETEKKEVIGEKTNKNHNK